MTGLGNLLRHPARPMRAIFLHRVPGEGDLWQADYRGDNWITAFRTVPGVRDLVLEALMRNDVRHGLPIIEVDSADAWHDAYWSTPPLQRGSRPDDAA